MILFFGIAALIIIAIVLTIKYFVTAKQVLDETSFENEVRRASERSIRKDRLINCDYCGAVVDTSKYDVCPSCGAAYDKDSEWAALRSVDDEKVRKEAADYTDRVKSTVRMRTKPVSQKLKKCILGLLAMILLLMAIFLWSGQMEKTNSYTRSDDPEKELQYYEPLGYGIDGDGVILDESGIKLTIGDLYRSTYDPWSYMAQVTYENSSGADAMIAAYCFGANGNITGEPYILGYEKLAGGTTVVKYERLFTVPFAEECDIEEISSLHFGWFSISDGDYNYLFEKDEIVTLDTTFAGTASRAVPQGEQIYEGHGVRITEAGAYRPYEGSEIEHVLWIANDSDCDFAFSAGFVVDGKELHVAGFYQYQIPAGMIMRGEFSSYDEAYQGLSSDDELFVVLGFECARDPALDFKTGYIKLQALPRMKE